MAEIVFDFRFSIFSVSNAFCHYGSIGYIIVGMLRFFYYPIRERERETKRRFDPKIKCLYLILNSPNGKRKDRKIDATIHLHSHWAPLSSFDLMRMNCDLMFHSHVFVAFVRFSSYSHFTGTLFPVSVSFYFSLSEHVGSFHWRGVMMVAVWVNENKNKNLLKIEAEPSKSSEMLLFTDSNKNLTAKSMASHSFFSIEKT